MAVNSLHDLGTSFTISKSEYENLIRISERLCLVTNYISGVEFPNIDTIKAMLEIKNESEE